MTTWPGVIVTEATQVVPEGQGYPNTPGIHTDAQVAGWKKADIDRIEPQLERAVDRIALRAGAERTLYESSESFTNRFMASIRGRTMDRFKRRYREGCDLLVLEAERHVEDRDVVAAGGGTAPTTCTSSTSPRRRTNSTT